VTDQRNRVTTDPGLGPIEVEHPSTLRSIAAAEPIAAEPIELEVVELEAIELEPIETDALGASVYYKPKPLNAVSDHKTLELETVKLAEDIDPRKLPTELTLRRPVLHVVPSEPSWGAPPSAEYDWSPPQYDSGWPPPETVLTTSQPPQAARRSLVPLLSLTLLAVVLLFVLGAKILRRSAAPAVAAERAVAMTLTAVAPPKKLAVLPSAAKAIGAAPSLSASLPPSPAASNGAAAVAAALPSSAARHQASSRPLPLPYAHSRVRSAPPTTKPKRAIY